MVRAARDPRRSERDRPPAPVDTTVSAFARAFFSRPGRVVASLQVIGAVAIAVLSLRHWPNWSHTVLLAALAVALANTGVWVAIGERLPRWSLQVDVAFGNLSVSAIVATGLSREVNLANL